MTVCAPAGMTVGDLQISVSEDSDALSPRQWPGNIATIVSWHPRADLGDRTVPMSHYADEDHVKSSLMAEHDIRIVEPLYLYDHSGMTVSLRPFLCPWDSGQVGWVFVTAQAIRAAYHAKRVTSRLLGLAADRLAWEVDCYDQWLRGDVYAYDIARDGETVDSLADIYGYDNAVSEARDAARRILAAA